MTTQQVRDTLGNEIVLLDHMIGCAQGFDGSKFTDQGKFIQGSWGRFLGERRATNVALQKSSDADLKADLESELSQVNAYIDVTDKSPGYSEEWMAFLTCERSILEYLINMC
jgi:hypothetical protein